MKSRLFIYVALGADSLIAISKFIAAGVTGSSSMFSEGIHSVIDAVSQVLLILGIKSSKRKPDGRRPFGYGKELYFWSFVVSLVIFVLGGCISFYQGVLRTMQPDFKGSPNWSYAILSIAFVFNMISMVTVWKAFNKQRGTTSFIRAIKESKDPSTFISLLGDVADLIGLIIAFLGVYLGRLFHHPYYDGVASMIIGIILIVISLFLARESKSLLMGETISKTSRRKIITVAEADEAVVKVKELFSMFMGPEEILLEICAVFKNSLTTEEITNAIERVSKTIRTKFPWVKHIYIEPRNK